MFKGVLTPVVTLFDEQGKVDFPGMEALVEHLIAGGVNGLLFLGSIGEFFTLRTEEKLALINFAVARVNRRVPVLIGTGGTIVEEVIELTRFAAQAGADGALVISPYYFNLGEEDLYRYYSQVAQTAQIPVLLYNYPNRTKVNLSPGLVARLARDFSNIVGIKDSVDNISHTRQLIKAVKPVRPDFTVLSGYDEYFLLNLMAGGDGVLCGLTNVVPEVFSDLLHGYGRGDFEAVREAQRKITILMQIYEVSSPCMGAIKGALVLRGLPVQRFVKAPSIEIGSEQENRIKTILKAVNL